MGEKQAKPIVLATGWWLWIENARHTIYTAVVYVRHDGVRTADGKWWYWEDLHAMNDENGEPDVWHLSYDPLRTEPEYVEHTA